MRRALVSEWPALIRFTFGALNPLSVDDYTVREVSEIRSSLRKFIADGGLL